MSWGYFNYPYLPQVSKNKWLVPEHMVNVCSRWRRDKTDNLQMAFFNGIGYESWENVWGIWNGIAPQDAEALRRVATLERGLADFLTSPDWRPYYPTENYGVFASEFPTAHATLWTMVNRSQADMAGPQIRVPYQPGMHYYDLYHGTELAPGRVGGEAMLSLDIEAHGYAAILASDQPAGASFVKLMQTMQQMTAKPLGSFEHEWKFLPQHIVPMEATKPPSADPPGMVKIPAGDFYFRVHGIEIEGDNDIGVDVQYPWEDSPRRYHSHKMHINAFWMDKYPVTNSEFKKFLDSSGYKPADDLNFLKDWKNGSYPDGWGNKPVTWVSLDDARAYAEWAGKRLPHEWEWQYAAQGTDERAYPWGNEWNSSAVPVPDKSRTMRRPDDVNAHDQNGGSPFGAQDLVGNVWQWTEEFQDDHTRAAILRGGSYYQQQLSVLVIAIGLRKIPA